MVWCAAAPVINDPVTPGSRPGDYKRINQIVRALPRGLLTRLRQSVPQYSLTKIRVQKPVPIAGQRRMVQDHFGTAAQFERKFAAIVKPGIVDRVAVGGRCLVGIEFEDLK